jgi:hypothetical protein
MKLGKFLSEGRALYAFKKQKSYKARRREAPENVKHFCGFFVFFYFVAKSAVRGEDVLQV